MQALRSTVFKIWLWVSMAVIGIGFLPVAIWSREGAYWVMRLYSRHVLWMLEKLCGVTYEVRGTPPQGEALIASKHQSFADMCLFMLVLPRAKYVMKRELKWMPVFGFYAMRIGTAPVQRGKGEAAVKAMTAHIAEERASGDTGQLVIFPQGTRVPPGKTSKYKIGTWRLYEAFGLECIPAALNTGLYWGKRTPVRGPGRIVVEFLDPIPPGREALSFMRELEQRIETASTRLFEETRAPRESADV